MNDNIKLASIAVITACLSACGSVETGNSDEVDQTNIFGQYSVRVDGATGQAELLAAFRYAGRTGTTLRLTSDSKIEVDGQGLNLVDGERQVLNLVGSYYASSRSAATLPAQLEFVWTRNDGQSFRTAVPVPQPVTPVVLLADGHTVVRPGETATVSRAAGAVQVTFEGSAVSADENIDCRLESDLRTGEAEGMSLVSGTWNHALQNCVFSSEQLKDFRLGHSTLTLKREWRKLNDAAGHKRAGSTRMATYESRPVDLLIVE